MIKLLTVQTCFGFSLRSGQDSTLRSFSTVHDSQNKSLGRASYHKAQSKKAGLKHDQHMMPQIMDFDSGIKALCLLETLKVVVLVVVKIK